MKRLFLLLCVLFAFHAAFSQAHLKGKVTDENHRPLAGVMIKVMSGKATVGFCTSGRDGAYECKFTEKNNGALVVSFRKLNYKEHLQKLQPGAKRLDVSLAHGGYQLREAVVSVPPVKALGDTVRYNLKSFLQSGDHTLEEGLKRLPGINVDESGTVSYMGRDISKFYIEGLNLLDGRYNLATQNIPAEKVAGVEVLRHHQANKVDREELSDNVALNIKLSSKARLKPFGAYEARVGYRPKKMLYGAGGTGMLFSKGFQMLGTLKLANDGRMGRNELFNHFGEMSWRTSAENALPLLSGARPPMCESRYLTGANRLFSINALKKLTDDNQFKVNADYSYRSSEHDYGIVTQYPAEAGAYIVTNEHLDFLQKEHRADVNLKFRSDKETRLLENTFEVRGRFADAESGVGSDSRLYSSLQETNTFGLRNELSSVWRINKWKLNFGSVVQFTDTPDNVLDISAMPDNPGGARQEARSRSFHTKETFYTGFRLWPSLTLALPLAFTANANRLQTRRQADTLALNALQGSDIGLSATPQIEWQTAGRRIRATIGLPLTLLIYDYCNKARASERNFTKLYADWAATLIYVPSGNVELKATNRLHQSFGDMADLLTGPVQTDYRTIRTRSGIFGRSKLVRSSLSFDWQAPLSFWHFTANLAHNRSISNIMGGQQVTGGNQSLLEVARDNTGDAFFASASLSKYFLSAKTNVSINASYDWRRNERINLRRVVTTYGSGYTVGGHFTTNPAERFQAGYHLVFRRSALRGGARNDFSDNWQQQASLAYTLRPGWLIGLSGEWQRNDLPAGAHQSFAFLDASMEYKFRQPKLRLRLELNNLLDARSYSYTVYDALNAYSYNYRLNGRECLLTLVLN